MAPFLIHLNLRSTSSGNIRTKNGTKYAKFSSILYRNCWNRNNHEISTNLFFFFILQVTHEFKNYGPGLAKIIYYHRGQATRCPPRSRYGSKMAGASVRVMIPKILNHKEITTDPIVKT